MCLEFDPDTETMMMYTNLNENAESTILAPKKMKLVQSIHIIRLEMVKRKTRGLKKSQNDAIN